MSDHVWVLENAETYLTGGLEPDERGRVDRHVSGCKECSRELAEGRAFDQALENLFAEARPAPGLESRMIEGIRAATRRRQPWPRLVRYAMGAAAVLFLGALGFALHSMGLDGNLRFPGEASRTGQHGLAPGTDLAFGTFLSLESHIRMDPAGGVLSPFDDSHSNIVSILKSDGWAQSKDGKGDEGKSHGESGAEVRMKEALGDVGRTLPGNGSMAWRSAGESANSPAALDGYKKTVPLSDSFGELAGKSQVKGRLEETESLRSHVEGSRKKLESADGLPDKQDKSIEKLKELNVDFGSRRDPAKLTPTAPPSPPKGTKGFFPPTSPRPPADKSPLPTPGDTASGGNALMIIPSKGPGYFNPGSSSFGLYVGTGEKGEQGKVADGKSGGKDPGESKADLKPGDRKRVQDAADKQEPGKEKGEGDKEKNNADNGKDPPAAAARKIIRTGEIEYEIDDFDRSVATITRLVTAMQGAFVATINSDKLANGKVKGSVVVRTPPDKLDKFLLDLRQEFSKVGELKNQRIGSQDVTKQYYDLESRLRAARTMEDRLINIIKTGKGEIKDLLAAERELGVWRTKIEEMEGEIRYYGNQVSLSTLTINLYEKELRAAAAMVVSERVNMRIEVDDVEKSLQAALAAVTEAKGRVTRSDLKKHPAGQYEGILHFEVAPAAVKPVRAKLDTLGVVTQHEAERLQQAEGGTNILSEIKSRQSDVQFHVALYNVANVQPRDTFVMQIASADVPADYRKLQDAVGLAKGQVRVGQLSEQDKLSVNAQLDFDVPAGQRETIAKLLAGLGDVLTRSLAQAAPGETATDRKVGYRVTLKNLDSIPARENNVLLVATPEVATDFRKVEEAVVAAKGRVRAGQLSEQDKLNESAQLDFDIPAPERQTIDKLLAGLGAGRAETLSRSAQRASAGETATDRKVGYRVTFKNYASIPPRETYIRQAVSPEVPAAYQQLQAAIAAAKGHVSVGNLNEQDKQNISAQLDFDVPVGAQGTIEKLLAQIGDVFSSTTNRAAAGENATDSKAGFRLTLRDVASMPAREKVTLLIEVKDVEQIATKLKGMVKTSGGSVVLAPIEYKPNGIVSAVLLLDVPLAAKDELVRKFKAEGTVRGYDEKPNPQAPLTKHATVHLNVVLGSSVPIVPSDEGLWPRIRTSLTYSFALLSYSLMFIILGLSVALPWALLLWAAAKIVRRIRKNQGAVGA